MDVEAAIGRILGMVMAYAVSALGLLLAYYNYRKRAGALEPARPELARREARAPAAGAGGAAGAALPAGVRPGPWIAAGLVAAVLVVGAAAVSGDHPSPAAAVLAQLPGILVPGAVFLLSFWLTWWLYRKFASGR